MVVNYKLLIKRKRKKLSIKIDKITDEKGIIIQTTEIQRQLGNIICNNIWNYICKQIIKSKRNGSIFTYKTIKIQSIGGIKNLHLSMPSRNYWRSNKGFPNNTKPGTTWNWFPLLDSQLDLTPRLLKLFYDIEIERILQNKSDKANIPTYKVQIRTQGKRNL